MSVEVILPDGSVVDATDEILTLVDPLGTIIVHRNEALKRTIEFWKTKGTFGAIRDVIMQEVQAAENALWQVKLSRFLDDAQGESLNILGRIVGEGRDGRDDASYRVRIRARIRVNSSFGHGDDILAMLSLLDDATFTLVPTPPASFFVAMSAPPSGFATAVEMAGLIGEAAAAGVGGVLVMPSDADGFVLGDTGGTLETSAFGDTGGTLETAPLPDGRLI
jgi:hypothetical protein